MRERDQSGIFSWPTMEERQPNPFSVLPKDVNREIFKHLDLIEYNTLFGVDKFLYRFADTEFEFLAPFVFPCDYDWSYILPLLAIRQKWRLMYKMMSSRLPDGSPCPFMQRGNVKGWIYEHGTEFETLDVFENMQTGIWIPPVLVSREPSFPITTLERITSRMRLLCNANDRNPKRFTKCSYDIVTYLVASRDSTFPDFLERVYEKVDPQVAKRHKDEYERRCNLKALIA